MSDQPDISALGGLGPFSAVDHHAKHAMPDGPWQPLALLLQPIGVRTRIEQVRGALAGTARSAAADVPWRVAGSVAHLGLVARLVSPQLAALLLNFRLDLDPVRTWWQPVVGGPVPLSVQSADGDAAGEGIVLDGVVAALTELFAAESISSRVLWGNVASAINGAFNAISSARPELAGGARSHVLRALDDPSLRNMSNARPGPDFRRTNCCLIYRLGPATARAGARQVCGDCVLR